MSSARGRVLVVDDERSMQEFLEIFLRSEGYEAVTVGGLAGARAASRSPAVTAW